MLICPTFEGLRDKPLEATRLLLPMLLTELFAMQFLTFDHFDA